jgi:phage terminase small subunit
MKRCPICKKEVKGGAKRIYDTHKCKKAAENAKKKKPISKKVAIGTIHINRPKGLNEIATDYWDKVAPTVISRGHLNVLSEDAFAELCDIYSRLQDVNGAINETNRSLLQIDDKWDNKGGVETQSFKESALSDLKRKYSRLLLDYCKQFYLTPLSNRGDFGLNVVEKRNEMEDLLD